MGSIDPKTLAKALVAPAFYTMARFGPSDIYGQPSSNAWIPSGFSGIAAKPPNQPGGPDEAGPDDADAGTLSGYGPSFNDAAADTGVFVGQQLGDAGFARLPYERAVSFLDGDDSAGRSLAKQQFREQTPRLVLAPMKAIRSSVGPPPGSGGRANVTNPAANRLGALLRVAGPAALAAGTAYDVYQAVNSPNPYRALAEAGGGLLGSLAGGTLGTLGGSLVTPIAGTIAGV